MSFKASDYVIFIFCNLIVLGFLMFRSKDRSYQQKELITLGLLWIIHFIFSFVFAFYILNNGGDSWRYWTITADSSQYANTWMDYFGISTFFIQWLNYIPFKVLKLSYLSGSMLYGLLSYAGIVLVFESLRYFIHQHKNALNYQNLLFVPLFLPGLHFWTAGVSKESLLFLGLSMMFYNLSKAKSTPYLAVVGWALCLLIRPLIGFVLLPILIYQLVVFLRKRDFVLGFRVLLILVLLLFKAGQHFLTYLHINEMTWESLRQIGNKQLSFLAEFDSNTMLPINEMNFLERILAVFFRPYIWESWDFYSLIFALENTWLILIMGFAIAYSWEKAVQIPLSIKYYAIIAFGMFLIFTFTLNNMGLYYRMKAIWLPFWHITFLWLICAASPRLKTTSLL